MGTSYYSSPILNIGRREFQSMSEQDNGKVKVSGRVPPDEQERFEQLRDKWGISDADAFRRVYSCGLDAAEGKYRTLREQLMAAVTWLAITALVMWSMGRILPRMPESSASQAAWATLFVAGVLLVAVGLLAFRIPGVNNIADRWGARQ